MDLKSIEERSLLVIEKYVAKLNIYDDNNPSGAHIPSLRAKATNYSELDERLNSHKEEMKAYIDRLAYQN